MDRPQGSSSRNHGQSPGDSKEVPERKTKRRHHRHGERNTTLKNARLLNATEKKTITSPESLATQAPGDDSAVFVVDRKGDRYNLQYGGLHQYIVPRYRTAGCGRLIGLDRGHKILPGSDPQSRQVGGSDPDYSNRKKTESLLSGTRENLTRDAVLVTRGSESDDDVRLQRDYLIIDSGKRKRRRTGAAELGLDVSSESGTESDQPVGIPNVEDAFDAFRKDINQQHQIALSKNTVDRPNDFDAWLALINHQQTFFDGVRSNKRNVDANFESRNLIEIKISIYEKALTKAKDPGVRDRLILGLLDEGSKIWETARLQDQWKSVLADKSSTSLRIRHLDFQQTNFITFSHDRCYSAYSECLAQTMKRDASGRDENCAYLVLRMTSYMRDAGFVEYAVALWQALLEYTFFRPSGVHDADEMSSFVQFWESESPRIGEEGAMGWKSAPQDATDPKSDKPINDVDPLNPFESWATVENHHAINARLPARMLDDVAEDDPYRVILFSDISKLVFRPSTSIGNSMLIAAFLNFCGMPLLSVDGTDHRRKWWADPFLCNYCDLDIDKPNLSPASNTLMSPTLQNFISDSSTLFAKAERWYSSWLQGTELKEVIGSPPITLSPPISIDPQWRRRALRQLVEALPSDDRFAEYVVAFELDAYGKEARKYAKSLLKSRPSSLRLYNAFALVEFRLGNEQAADVVWSTALSMSRSFEDHERKNTVLLWRSWIWEAFDRKDLSQALVLLHKMRDMYPSNPVNYDAAQDNLQDGLFTSLQGELSKSLTQADWEAVVYYTELLGLLAYLTTSHSLATALEIYATTASALPPDKSLTSVEYLHQSRARLIHFHATSSPLGYKPVDIVSALSESIHLFPTNTIFLSLYSLHTRHTMLLDRIRSIMPVQRMSDLNTTDQTWLSGSIIIPVFAIRNELARPLTSGSTAHSIRAAFEQAVSRTSPAKSSLVVWRCYLHWSLREAAKDENLATRSGSSPQSKKSSATASPLVTLFFRALRACPWAKELYLLGLGEKQIHDAVGRQGLREIYDSMVDRGLRVHVDIDERA